MVTLSPAWCSPCCTCTTQPCCACCGTSCPCSYHSLLRWSRLSVARCRQERNRWKGREIDSERGRERKRKRASQRRILTSYNASNALTVSAITPLIFTSFRTHSSCNPMLKKRRLCLKKHMQQAPREEAVAHEPLASRAHKLTKSFRV